MPACFSLVCRLAAVGLVAVGLAGSVLATEHEHAAPAAADAKAVTKPDAKVDTKAEVKAEVKAESKAETKAEKKPDTKPETKADAKAEPFMRDPMDVVRERLAAKLSTIKPPDAAGSNVLHVVSKAPPASEMQPAASPKAAYASRKLAIASVRPEAAVRAEHSMLPAQLPTQWDYAGSGGPDAWAQLKPEFAACSSGQRQSPIDIRDGIKVNLDPVLFDYKPSAFRVIDNGHTVQVNVGPGNAIEVMGKRYDLVQFHFHRPSEERVNGRQFDMVMHLVHKDADGRLAVVAVLLDRGSAQPVVQTIWNNLPLEKGDEVAAKGTLDPNAMLPAERSYYTYMGSLTEPPCSEGVLWMVMKDPVPISAEQIAIFARLYPMNARPIQSASGRLIKESN